jgi:hypothetical protein
MYESDAKRIEDDVAIAEAIAALQQRIALLKLDRDKWRERALDAEGRIANAAA